MCGICGWINPAGVDFESLVDMNCTVAHRGPDGEGYWLWDGQSPTGDWISRADVPGRLSSKGIIGLGNRRLAILDLSEAGLQPMPSENKREWVVCNGEIYNYIELRSELAQYGYQFRTGTDTEVILAAYKQWGTECFARFNGMWGLAIVDLDKRVVILSRDRLGIKPLYIWANSGSLAFASEIKQFLALPRFAAVANMDAVVEYIDTGYEIPPATFFKDVKAFPPGCYSVIAIDEPRDPLPKSYWTIENFSPSVRRRAEAEVQLRALFEDAVRLRLRSDVPVGVCLSGGLDSSAIFGQIQQLTNHSESTHAFSASYREKQFDESEYVEIVKQAHGGRVHYTYPSAQAFLDDFDDFIYFHDEPPGSLSQYAAWDVMRMARQHNVPVLLNGQGGDELFSGYWPAYYLFLRQSLPRHPWLVAAHLAGSLLPGGNPELLIQAIPHFQRYRRRRVRDNRKILSNEFKAYRLNGRENWAIQAQRLSSEEYRWNEIQRIHLPRLLKWDDRNSMAFSIEGRYPFLDYRIVEFAVRLPVGMNFHRGWNKYLLRKALARLLPPQIQWRRTKVGFVTPQSEWIRTTLRPVLEEWVEIPSKKMQQITTLPQLRQLAKELFSAQEIHQMDEHQLLLFRLFALEKWLQVYKVQL